MIRTLVADDSPAFREALVSVLKEDPAFDVVACARDGAEAVHLARMLRPELIIMDVVMPGMSGLKATVEIMSQAPCAVVVMSNLMDTSAQQVAFEALRAGAVEVMSKPRDMRNKQTKDRLCLLLKAMSGVKVVRRRLTVGEGPLHPDARVLAIGCSTGGPPALREVLRHLPDTFPAAVAVAQHLASGFTRGLSRWLAGCLDLQVEVVERAVRPRAGCVFLPADDHHLVYADGCLRSVAGGQDSPVPSVDRLFESLVEFDSPVVGVLLTGMGSDGARGLKLLRDRGCHTIVQDEETSLIYGMPRVARELGGAAEELPIHSIGRRLLELFGRGTAGGRP
jgi:chemotaxis response regulator CheB